jgi:hypothetical protein
VIESHHLITHPIARRWGKSFGDRPLDRHRSAVGWVFNNGKMGHFS